MIDSTNIRIIADNIRHLFKKVNSIEPGTVVQGNPSGSGFNTLLTKIKIGNSKYKLPAESIPNPEAEATDELTKLQIGETVYELGGGSDVDYSTTEQLTGKTWNGKPEYVKSFFGQSLSRGTGNSFAHGISNLDEIHSCEWGFVDDYHNGMLGGSESSVINYTDAYITYNLASGASSSTKANITIKYTKIS